MVLGSIWCAPSLCWFLSFFLSFHRHHRHPADVSWGLPFTPFFSIYPTVATLYRYTDALDTSRIGDSKHSPPPFPFFISFRLLPKFTL